MSDWSIAMDDQKGTGELDPSKEAALNRRIADLEHALGDEASWFDRAIRAEKEIEAWKDACSFIGQDGDPDSVTPESVRAYWENIERIGERVLWKRDYNKKTENSDEEI